MLETRLRKIAAAVIKRSDRARPADAVLRAELKSHRGLSRQDAGLVSEAVFAYFRWFGWLQNKSIDAALEEGVALDDRFAEDPRSFSDEEIRDNATPSWVRDFVDVTADWARALQRKPILWLRSRSGRSQSLCETLRGCHIDYNSLPQAIRYDGDEDLFRTPEFHNGVFELQDISSQIVGLVCAPKLSETWWDACAGEGGKMLHLSDLMQNKGLIWASDRADWRLKKLKQRAARAQSFNYRTSLWNGGEKLPTKTRFDGVLVDAPCSGIGTWGRNPHARWTTSASDVQELAEVQRQLLQHAAKSLKPGGRLIYSVCTLSRAETTEVADQFQQLCSDLEPIEIKNPLRPNTPASQQLWLWPQDCGGNGMFVTAWGRKS